jgi:DNA-binding NtrC family response regulator
VLNDGEQITAAMLGAIGQLKAAPAAPAAAPAPAPERTQERAPGERGITPLWQVERAAIEDAIRICNGNIPRAAALLEVSPSTIYRKRQAWEAGGAG